MNKLRGLQPSNKRIFYYDEGQPGLRLLVTPTGNKSFQFQMWSKKLGKPLTRTIGKFQSFSLSKAREEAAALIAEMNSGTDIESERKKERETPTFSKVWKLYLENHAKKYKKSWEQDEQTYKRQMKKQFGAKRVDQITVKRVKKWHTDIGKQSGHYAANRALDLLSNIYNVELPDMDNPCRRVKKYTEMSRERFLEGNELEAFFKALSNEPDQQWQDFFMLLLLTGQRKMNVAAMHWNEIDLTNEVWNIPHDKTKNKKPTRVPLVAPAIKILARRKQDAKSVYVFPSKRSQTGHIVSPKKKWNQIIQRAELKDVRIHDLRRTAGSWMAGGGESMLIIGKALGHVDGGSTAVYARLDLDPVRRAMEKATTAMLKNDKKQ